MERSIIEFKFYKPKVTYSGSIFLYSNIGDVCEKIYKLHIHQTLPWRLKQSNKGSIFSPIGKLVRTKRNSIKTKITWRWRWTNHFWWHWTNNLWRIRLNPSLSSFMKNLSENDRERNQVVMILLSADEILAQPSSVKLDDAAI